MKEYSVEEIRALANKEWTEAKLQKTVNKAVKLHGFRFIHLRPAFVGVKGKPGSKWEGRDVIVTAYDGDDGFPDTVAMKDRVGIAWELKVGKNVATPGQLEWLRLFRLMGFDTRVAYPRDLESMLQYLGEA